MRVLIYSHDTYGLGHLRRSLVMARALATSHLGASVLIATGSPRAHAFALPPNCDTLKMPSILKQTDGTYAARDLDLSLEEVVALRANLLCSTFRDFAPDLIIVDHAPVGVEGELFPLLQSIREASPKPKLVLGMRDIVDDAELTEKSWRKSGGFSAIEDDYDRVFVYGEAWVPTTAVEMGLEALIDTKGEQKVRHLGYLAPENPRCQASGRFLVTAGGGGDGHALLRSFIGFLSRRSAGDVAVDIVTGPFLSERRFETIQAQVDDLDGHDVELIRFDPQIARRVAAAKGVIGMAGYNTVAEIMSSDRRALLVPREVPRVEQLLRAQRLSKVCGFSWCRLSELSDATFQEFIEDCIDPKTKAAPSMVMNGAQCLVDEVGELFGNGAFTDFGPREAMFRENAR